MKTMKMVVIIILIMICAIGAIISKDNNDSTNDYYRKQIGDVSIYTGLPYLGDVDVYEISKKHGGVYDGMAVTNYILNLTGHNEGRIVCRVIGIYGDMVLQKVTVYKSNNSQLIVGEYLITII